MKRSFIISLAFLALILMACPTPNDKPLTHEEKHAIGLEVNKVLDNWFRAPKENFIKHIMDGIHFDSNTAMVADGLITIGGEAMRKYMHEGLKDVEYISDVQTPTRYTHVLTRDVVVITLNYEEKIHLKTGEIFPNKGGFQYVFKKIDDNWKVVNMAGTHTK